MIKAIYLLINYSGGGGGIPGCPPPSGSVWNSDCEHWLYSKAEIFINMLPRKVYMIIKVYIELCQTIKNNHTVNNINNN